MMVPAGYLAKRVAARPEWLAAARVSSIYSVSGCVSEDFAYHVPFWKHNGYWLFDSAEAIAAEHAVPFDLVSMTHYTWCRSHTNRRPTPCSPIPRCRRRPT